MGLVVLPMGVSAQTTTTFEDVDAAAKIIKPIAMTKTAGTELNFGVMTSPAAATKVAINFAATRSVTSGATTFVTTGVQNIAPQVPEFVVTGENSAAYTITLPTSPVDLISGANSMTVTDFLENATNALSLTGTETFKVSASLNIGEDQPAGAYTGVFDVTVLYN